MYTHQNIEPMYICGDFNISVGARTDYMYMYTEGVDDISER